MRAQALKDFQTIPGVGKTIAKDFWDIGIRTISDLNGADSELLYEKLCRFQNTRVDRCMLYLFRCAVYFATEKQHDPELLKWWNWKDD
ncbi:MAG: hypothetical protein KR126chlam3_00239 [Chlamydiae bacterium]|nr:hypothetical protein [Chlamydiota bacterium]